MFCFNKKQDSFNEALKFTLSWEGGYVNDPDDPGGETKWGISKRSYPAYDIKNLTRDAAKVIYRRDYWEAGKCDKLPTPVGIVHFDACVNLGVSRAERLKSGAIDNPDKYAYATNLIDSRDDYYIAIATKRPKFKKYLRGWLNRTSSLRELVNKHMKKG